MDLLAGMKAAFAFEVRDLDGQLVSGITSWNVTIQAWSVGVPVSPMPPPWTITECGIGIYAFEMDTEVAKAGWNYFVRVQEPAGAKSQEAIHSESFRLLGSLQVNTETCCWCSVSDIEALLQRGSFSASTRPTIVQVQSFIRIRSAAVTAALAGTGCGVSAPGGANPPESGSTLAELCRGAAQYLAAYDAITAIDAREKGDLTDRAKEFKLDGEATIKAIEAIGRQMTAEASAAASTATVTQPEDRHWSLRSEW